MCKFNPLRSFRIFAKFPPAGIGLLSHSGRWLVPGIERGSSAGEVRKSERVGPASRSSVKAVLVRRRRGVDGETVARLRTVAAERAGFAFVFTSGFGVLPRTCRHWLKGRIACATSAGRSSIIVGEKQSFDKVLTFSG